MRRRMTALAAIATLAAGAGAVFPGAATGQALIVQYNVSGYGVLLDISGWN
ncbi:hypothetical protein QMK19_19580 [Streptomyces sp. H10-C2]|uniref:hypothetical protein n=1 Tax=unclassified Streptomyces TaxID=2593676 RepID=UPI0024BBCBDD|nr:MULTISPECIES: hypothetical protein [unclassified Streptomyces]MDJ0343372.1 hypothetical protein [Streptomyces sp. PH10-H1]MDJ0371817.1 hypothetical protein [Streptomyces sp. H10-C2]